VYVYTDVGGDVLACSTVSRTVEQVQGKAPGVVAVVPGAPSSVVCKLGFRTGGLPAYYHRHTSGDGTDAAHYTQVVYLDTLRALRFGETDKQTQALLCNGFAYGGKTLSMCITSQVKADGYARLSAEDYPIELPTCDDSEIVSLADAAALDAYRDAQVAALKAVIDGGDTLKAALRSATTKAEIDAVVDTR